MTFRNTNLIFFTACLVLIVFDWQTGLSNWFYAGLVIVYLVINAYGTLYISAQFFMPARFKGERGSNSVAITFDDGPVPESTTRILEMLRKEGVKATFFCIGKNVQDHPALAKQIQDEGHLVGNHSYFHGSMFDLQSPRAMMEELKNTNRIVQQVTGKMPRFFRPPYGVTNPMLAKAVKQLNLVTTGWSVRSFDTIAKEKTKLYERVTKNLKGGDIILFHDRCELTRQILPDLLAHIRKSGLKVEALDVMLNEKAYA
jgi:peptidoglycan-N-acetylglucosamine deacetylase